MHDCIECAWTRKSCTCAAIPIQAILADLMTTPGLKRKHERSCREAADR